MIVQSTLKKYRFSRFDTTLECHRRIDEQTELAHQYRVLCCIHESMRTHDNATSVTKATCLRKYDVVSDPNFKNIAGSNCEKQNLLSDRYDFIVCTTRIISLLNIIVHLVLPKNIHSRKSWDFPFDGACGLPVHFRERIFDWMSF